MSEKFVYKMFSKILAVGSSRSGLTSKICLPAMAGIEIPIVYFGKQFYSKKTVDYLKTINKTIIQIKPYEKLPSILSNNIVYYIDHDYFFTNIKINVEKFLQSNNVILSDILVIVDEDSYINLDNINNFKNLIVITHSLNKYNSIKNINFFDNILILSFNFDNINILSNLVKISKNDLLQNSSGCCFDYNTKTGSCFSYVLQPYFNIRSF